MGGAILAPAPIYADDSGGSVQEAPYVCQDSLYLKLQKRPLGDMSAREYEYFVRKDKECDEERRLILLSTGGLGQSGAVGTPEPHRVQASHQDHGQAEDHGASAGHVVLHTILMTVPMLVVMGAMAL